MTTPSAPAVHRNWQQSVPLNHYTNDYMSDKGVRVSTPLYIDVSSSMRKEAFNKLRELAKNSAEETQSTTGDVRVVSYSTMQPAIEAFLGMSLDVLRSVIFNRGGLQLDLVIRIQAITGQELISEKDITAAFKKKADLIKAYIKENTFNV